MFLGHPSDSCNADGQGHTVSPAALAVTALQMKESAVPGQHEEYDWLALELCVSLACSQACAAELQLKGMYSEHIKNTPSETIKAQRCVIPRSVCSSRASAGHLLPSMLC